jgi:hypothetical protein
MGVFFFLTMALLRGINWVGEVLDYNTLVFAVGCRERKRNTLALGDGDQGLDRTVKVVVKSRAVFFMMYFESFRGCHLDEGPAQSSKVSEKDFIWVRGDIPNIDVNGRRRRFGGNFDSLWCLRSDGVRVIREMRTVEG